jgi:EAL domain-containing protein (putative c-di-GMP-specific phosphodiesterase class I)
VVGVEALLRWKDPDRGIVPPNQFIPLAEEIGLMLPIGAWVLEAACRQAILCNPDTLAVRRASTTLHGAGEAPMLHDTS